MTDIVAQRNGNTASYKFALHFGATGRRLRLLRWRSCSRGYFSIGVRVGIPDLSFHLSARWA